MQYALQYMSEDMIVITCLITSATFTITFNLNQMHISDD